MPISQAESLPDQVLIKSTICRKRSVMAREKQKPSGSRRMAWVLERRSGLLRGGLGALAEVVVVGHLAAHVGVEIPLHDALGELLLRFGDLDEHGVVLALVGGCVV